MKLGGADGASSRSQFKKWAGALWPIGGTVLGLIVVPVAIAQYPDFFNENRWVLPSSVGIVVLCWLIPLFVHDRVRRLYEWIAGLDGGAKALALIVIVGTIVIAYEGSTKLLRFHEQHLRAALTATQPPPSSTAKAHPAPEKSSPKLQEPKLPKLKQARLNPLEIVAFRSDYKIEVYNKGPLAAYVISLVVDTKPPGESKSFGLDLDVPPGRTADTLTHADLPFKNVRTTPKMGNTWQQHMNRALELYGNCGITLIYFSPSDPSLQQIKDHYLEEHEEAGYGDISGTLYYRLQGIDETKSQTVPIVVLTAVNRDDCPP